MITDHVFREERVTGSRRIGTRTGTCGGPRVDPGQCWYLTSCNQPESEHITATEYRARRSP